jgi:hypothetical protein
MAAPAGNEEWLLEGASNGDRADVDAAIEYMPTVLTFRGIGGG